MKMNLTEHYLGISTEHYIGKRMCNFYWGADVASPIASGHPSPTLEG